MLQYVNSFGCTVSGDTQSLVIQFIQNEPVIPDEEGKEITTEPNHVVSLVMEKDCALNLAETLANFYLSPVNNTDTE